MMNFKDKQYLTKLILFLTFTFGITVGTNNAYRYFNSKNELSPLQTVQLVAAKTNHKLIKKQPENKKETNKQIQNNNSHKKLVANYLNASYRKHNIQMIKYIPSKHSGKLIVRFKNAHVNNSQKEYAKNIQHRFSQLNQ